ncbi:MAG: PHP domain-containing protein, partial [Clostridiales bacterium]|nr:PHP domain-containing protein [Clostridiales bacterium]
MDSTTPIAHICRNYKPPKELEKAYSLIKVETIKGDRTKKQMSFRCVLKGDVPDEEIEKIEQGIKNAYSLSLMKLEIKRIGKEFDDELADMLISRIKTIFPSIQGFLAGCTYEYIDRKIKFNLVNGGVELLSEPAKKIEKILTEEYGIQAIVEFVSASGISSEELEREHEEDRERLIQDQIEKSAAETPISGNSKDKEKGKRSPQKPRRKARVISSSETVILGKPMQESITEMKDLNLNLRNVTVQGDVFSVNHRYIGRRDLYIVNFDITDYTNSVRISKPMDGVEGKAIADAINVGDSLIISGQVVFDNYDCEMIIRPASILKTKKTIRQDMAEKKRVELHMHTTMSAMDGVTEVEKLIERAAAWGHPAVAVTDHGVVQSFPLAMQAAKKSGIKVIYGVEGYYNNTKAEVPIVTGELDAPLDGEIVVFDIETTGLTPVDSEIIEIGAVIMKKNDIVGKFSSFVKPT